MERDTEMDALAFRLMRELDKNEALSAELEEMRVQNVLQRRQLEAADWHMDFTEWANR